MIRLKRTAILLLLLFAATLTSFIGCQPKDTGENDMVFSGPIELGAGPGDRLPGTAVEVLSISDGSAEIRLEDQIAHKKVGDSLDWKGDLTPHVHLALALRIIWISDEHVQTAGTATLTVRDVAPAAGRVASESETRYALPVTYSVPKGERIPGTTVEYVGKDAEKGATFAGVEGYPYRKVADSLVWEGRLREGVWLKLDLRLLLFSDASAQLGGIATIWVEGP